MMKKNILKIKTTALLAVVLTLATSAVYAQPNWEVNPYEYVHSMTISGKITTDGYFSTDTNDRVAAFIDGECRGVANVVYKTSLNDYFVFLLVYSNETTGTVTFKIYDHSRNEIQDAKQTINFTVNDILGTADKPFIFSASSLNSGAQLLGFNIPNQEGATIISGNNVYLQQHWSGSLTNIAAGFVLSEGATAWVNGIEQDSGVTVNNFTQPVEYEIISADRSASAKYIVEITTANDIPSNITLSENKKQENDALTFIGFFTVETANPAETHILSLVNAPDADNEHFYINGTGLRARNPFNYEEKQQYRILVRADDEKGGVVEKYFTINIIDVNDAPANVGLTNTNTPVNAPPNTTIGQLVAIDEDVNDTHIFTLIEGNGVNNRDNNRFYIENNLLKCSETLAFIDNSKYKIRVKAEDSGNKSVEADLEITSKKQGNPPYNLTLTNTQVVGTENPPVFVGMFATEDIDQENGHVFGFATDSVLGADNHHFAITGNGLYLVDPLPVAEKNSYLIMVTVTDSMGNWYSRNFTIRVSESLGNQQFMLSNNQLPENQPENTVIGHFQTAENPNRNGYSYTLPLDVDLLTFSNNKFKVSGRTLLSNQVFDYENSENLKVKVEVFDGENVTQQEVPVMITDVNDAPESIALSTLTVSESAIVNSEIATLSAGDQDANDNHTFSLVIGNGLNDESNNWFKIEGNKLLLSKPLNFEEKEYHNILIRVADKENATFEQAFRVQVANANDAPQILGNPPGFVLQNNVFVYKVETFDSEGDQIQVSCNGLPEWLTFTAESGIISGSPANKHVGLYNFSIIASDGNKTSTQHVSLSVINVNDAPKINYVLGNQIFFVNTSNEIVLPADCFTDPDASDLLSYTLLGENNTALPGWLVFQDNALTLAGNPAEDAIGTYRLKLIATDNGGLSEWMMFELRVSLLTAAETKQTAAFSIYPNPAANVVYVNLPKNTGEAFVSVLATDGKKLKTYRFQAGYKQQINISGLKAGLYFVKLEQGNFQGIEKLMIK